MGRKSRLRKRLNAIDTQRPSRKVEAQFRQLMNADCALLKLPGEIRNRIYELTVPNEETLSLDYYVTDNSKMHCWWLTENYSGLALMSVCSQLRAETIGFFYGRNAFVTYSCFLSTHEAWKYWLASRPPAALCALRSLVLCDGVAGRNYSRGLITHNQWDVDLLDVVLRVHLEDLTVQLDGQFCPWDPTDCSGAEEWRDEHLDKWRWRLNAVLQSEQYQALRIDWMANRNGFHAIESAVVKLSEMIESTENQVSH